MSVERKLGQYPISIATSSAIESLMGIHPDRREASPPIKNFRKVYINLRTLFRNLIGCLPSDQAYPEPDLLETILDEMSTIQGILKQAAHVDVIYYLANNSSHYELFPLSKPRQLKTFKQQDYELRETWVVKQAVLHTSSEMKVDVHQGEFDVEYNANPSVILTHITMDLLGASKCTDMTLLESHTGRLKRETEWYTKYYDSKNLPVLPFRLDFMSVFGDSTYFSPMPVKYRRALTDLALKYNWNAITTSDRIFLCAEKIEPPELRQEFFTKILKRKI